MSAYQRRAVGLAALLLALTLVLGIGGAAAKKKHKKHRHKLPNVTTLVYLNETPVQSGVVTASPTCRKSRFIEIRRADNDALVGSATPRSDGTFGAAGGYSGPAYAVTRVTRRGRVRCLAADSVARSIGVADLTISQAAVPSDQTAGNPAYDITVTNAGPDTAQSVVVVSTPQAQPSGGGFTLDVANSSSGCTLASGAVTCRITSVYPGQSQVRRIALDCTGLTLYFLNTAKVTSTARDPSPAGNISPGLTSYNCI